MIQLNEFPCGFERSVKNGNQQTAAFSPHSTGEIASLLIANANFAPQDVKLYTVLPRVMQTRTN